MDIVDFVENVLKLKLFPHQRIFLKTLSKIKGPYYLTYGKPRFGRINPEDLSEIRGLRSKMMIYDDCKNDD